MEKPNQFVEFFRFFDIFKHSFSFRIGKKVKSSTIFSISVSIIFLVPLIIYFVVISLNTLKHTSPKINVQEFDVNDRPYMNISQSNFRLAFKIIGGDSVLDIKDSSEYFDFTIVYTKFIRNNHNKFEIKESKSFELSLCNESNFLDFSTYYSLNLKRAFCLLNHNFSLGGFWDEKEIEILKFELALCNSSKRANCKKKEILESALHGAYLYMYIESQDVDAYNYLNPLKKSMKTHFQLIDLTIRKETNIFFQQIQLKTNDAFIYNNDPNYQTFNKQYSVSTDFLQKDNKNPNFASFTFFSSNKIQTIERSYMTIIEAAAIVGGISNFLFILGAILTFMYNDMKLNNVLINRLFIFNFKDNINEPKKNQMVEIVKEIKGDKNKEIHNSLSEYVSNNDIKNIDIRNFDNLIKLKINNEKLQVFEESPSPIKEKNHKINNFKSLRIDDKDEKIFSQDSPELKKLQFSGFEIFRCIIMPFFLPKELKIKFQLYQNAIHGLLKYINIVHFVQMLQDIENLKKVLLNKHQINLFKHIAKPVITIEKIDSSMRILEYCPESKLNKVKIDLQEIKEYFYEKKTNNQLSQIDLNLYELLETDLKKNKIL